MKEPRPYQDECDLEAMRNLLVAGRKADNGTYYIHTGDLSWWVYYPPLKGGFWDHIYLWDDPAQPKQVLGWTLISPDWVGIDVYVHPKLRGNLKAKEMYLWAEAQAIKLAREGGKTTTHVLWVSHDDHELCNHFRGQGYRLARGYVHFIRNLDGMVPSAPLSGEFMVRGCMGESELTSRAAAQYGAFGSSAHFGRYLERFRNFMHSPVYDPNLDIVVSTSDGQIGAFCIVWMDKVNKVGLFEPVGTHPNFQRKGLGKAVMLEGLRRLWEGGMNQAIVSTFEDNQAAIKLYESVGFRVVNKLGTYEKDV